MTVATGGQRQETRLSGGSSRHCLHSLKPDTRYRISVFAQLQDGFEGPAVTVTQATREFGDDLSENNMKPSKTALMSGAVRLCLTTPVITDLTHSNVYSLCEDHSAAQVTPLDNSPVSLTTSAKTCM